MKIKVYTPDDVLFAFLETKEGKMLWKRRQTLSKFEDSLTDIMLNAEENEDNAAERIYNLLNAVSKEYKEACKQFDKKEEEFLNENCELCFIDL